MQRYFNTHQAVYNKFKLVIFLIFASQFIAPAQVNLVPNGGFELASPCPAYPGQINYATGWNNVNLVYNNFMVGTPDFFHACGTTSLGYSAQPPATFAGTCTPNTGSGFVATVLYNIPYPNAREYISTKLICPMVTGTTYTVSFWITNGTGPKSPFIVKNVGANFSTAPLTQTGFNLISLTPQCEITGYSGTNAWVQYTFAITATANWQYITLGNFRNDAANAPMSVYPGTSGPPSVYANYFWDDISVVGPNSNISTTLNSQNVTCGSTNNGSATITPVSPGTYTYNWQPGNQSTQSISNLTAGIYTVSITNGCISDTKTISITQQPTPSVTVNSVTTCANSTINVTANAIGGTPGYTYSWSQSSSTSSVVTINAIPGVITCTATDSQGCKAIGNAPVVISPVTSTFNYNMDVCKGILTTTNTSMGATQYQWYFGDGGTSSLASPSYTYSSAGNYNLSLVATTSSGCKDSIVKAVNVSNPSQSLFSFTATTCNSNITLNNTSVGATTYQWNFGDGNTSTQSNPGTHNYSSPGIYTVSLITDPGSPCSDTLKQIVTISQDPVSQFNVFTTPCSMSVTTTNSSTSAINYSWNFGDGSTSTLNNPSHTYASSGTYTITLISNPGTSCADTTYNTVTLGNAPIASFIYVKDICSATVTFSNTSANASGYMWYFGGFNSSSETDPSFNFSNAGTYTVLLVAQPGVSCADSVRQIITVNYYPVHADFAYENPLYSNDINFFNLSTNGYSYEWSFGDGYGSTLYEPSHSYEQMGLYTVCLQTTNFQGCSDVICKNINVDSDWTLYVPDAFTPNADNINDIFHAYGTNIKDFHMDIFDRWGEKIFASDDIRKGWDGTYKGKLVKDDVYVWKINFTDSHSKAHDKAGHVTFIR